MAGKLKRLDGPGIDSHHKVAEFVRRNNEQLQRLGLNEKTLAITDRITECVFKLRRWMHQQNVTIHDLARKVGVTPSIVAKWVVGQNRPTPIYRSKIQSITNDEIRSEEWSTQAEIRHSIAVIDHYNRGKKALEDRGVWSVRRERWRDADRMRVYNAYIRCGMDMPFELRAFIERNPNGAWRFTGPA